MRSVLGLFPLQVGMALSSLAVVVLALPAAAQVGSDTRADKDFAATGQLTVQIQSVAGTAFSEGATIELFTRDIQDKQSAKSDPNGIVHFTGVPVGEYVIEVAAPGYRTVQEQVIIARTYEAQKIVVSMVPTSVGAKGKGGSAGVAAKAVKETEKGLHALQINNLNDAQQHLSRALTIEPNFADGNYLMGVLLIRQKQAGKAAGYLRKSVELSPDHASALLALGEAEYLEHDYPQATESLERFLREQPQSAQAVTAQNYVAAMRSLEPPKTSTESGSADSASSRSGMKGSGTTEGVAAVELPPLPPITPVTETSWAPPDVDEQKFDVDSSTPCLLDEVVQTAGNRVQELVRNVDRFTATEEIDHYNLSPMGLQTAHEARKFDYVVEIRQLGKSDLDVEEYRNGSVSIQNFPGHIANVGLPSLALVFHPYFQAMYEFKCEGRGAWHGNPAWLVHFKLRAGQGSAMLVYHVGGRSRAVGLKGRAWIDAGSSQILAMESDIMHPLPEIRLLRDHQIIEYGPVSFRNNSMQLWLPKNVDWYCSLAGRRYHRHHTFSGFLLFSIDDKQKITKPSESAGSTVSE